MKLYYIQSSCSLSPHIVATEAGFNIELVRVDSKTKLTESGEDFTKINPKGYVPCLQLDDGTILTEGPTIVQYLADQKPELKLAPAAGTLNRYRLQEMLGFINSELHQGFMPLFYPDTPEQVRTQATEKLLKKFAFIESSLKESNFIFGENFTVADAYLFVVTQWSQFVKLDLSAYPKLMAFQTRVSARPSVKTAMQKEKEKSVTA